MECWTPTRPPEFQFSRSGQNQAICISSKLSGALMLLALTLSGTDVRGPYYHQHHQPATEEEARAQTGETQRRAQTAPRHPHATAPSTTRSLPRHSRSSRFPARKMHKSAHLPSFRSIISRGIKKGNFRKRRKSLFIFMATTWRNGFLESRQPLVRVYYKGRSKSHLWLIL